MGHVLIGYEAKVQIPSVGKNPGGEFFLIIPFVKPSFGYPSPHPPVECNMLWYLALPKVHFS